VPGLEVLQIDDVHKDTGGVLVADDVGNTIWRTAPAAAASATASP